MDSSSRDVRHPTWSLVDYNIRVTIATLSNDCTYISMTTKHIKIECSPILNMDLLKQHCEQYLHQFLDDYHKIRVEVIYNKNEVPEDYKLYQTPFNRNLYFNIKHKVQMHWHKEV